MEWMSAFVPGGKPDGTPIISVIGRRSYDIAHGSVRVSEQQDPVCDADIFADPDNEMYSEVLAETDLIPFKPTTDVAVLGKACAPRGRKVYHVDCTVQVGPLQKTVRVLGDRQVESKALRGLVMSDPQPFEEMELGYRRAYGGMAKDKNGTLFSFLPNPIGAGFALRGGVDDERELRVPNIEDPSSPFTADHLVLAKYEEWQEAPKPASLGWTRRNFYPRYTYAGVLPEYLEACYKTRDQMKAKYPQAGSAEIRKMDSRVYQGASEGLWGQQLVGNEPVRLSYLDPDYPQFEFQLPGERPTMILDLGEGPHELEPVLQTVIIDKTNNRLAMVWRGAMVYGGIEELEGATKMEWKAEG